MLENVVEQLAGTLESETGLFHGSLYVVSAHVEGNSWLSQGLIFCCLSVIKF